MFLSFTKVLVTSAVHSPFGKDRQIGECVGYHHRDGVSTNRPFKWQCRHRELPALIHPPLPHHWRGAMVPASPIYSPLTRGPAFRLVRTLLWWPLPGAGKLAAGGWAWFPQTKAISGTFFLPKCDFPFYFFFLSHSHFLFVLISFISLSLS